MKMKCLIILTAILMSMQIHALSTKGNQILDANGNPIAFKAFSWFGFNNGDTMVDGLWDSSNPLGFDFATVVYRQQLLGFNAVRLPFSFTNFTIPPRNFEQPCSLATQSQIQANVTDPSVPVPPGATIPPQVSPPTRVAGECNSYLPNTSTMDRFLWVINFFAKNGFYVLIDDHTEDQTILQNVHTWQNDWVSLYTAICQDPISKSMVMLDLLNEPDGRGIVWEARGNSPSLTSAYLNVMDALYAVNNNALFFIEGAGQGGIGCNWGDGFCTDENLIRQFGLSDPNPFFQALLQKPYLNQVVISPHVYPPSVTGQSTSQAEGPGLWSRLSESFGYLTQAGYCFNGACKVFPVAIGEFGSMFATSVDIQSMKDIALYLNNSGAAADGLHKLIDSWFYWDWNANSGDTGGLVDNSWVNILWNKVEYLQTLGLNPWYTKATPTQFGKLCLTINPATGLTANELLPITVGEVSFPITSFNSPLCETVAVGGYTVKPPQITTSTMVFTAPSQNVTITQGGTTNASIVYTGKNISNGGSLCLTVAPATGLNASQLMPITVGGVSFPVTAFNTAVCETLSPGGYTITPPQITTSTMVFKAPSQNVTVTQGGMTNATINYTGTPIDQGNFIVKVQLGTPWQNSPTSTVYNNAMNLYVENIGTQKVNVPWTLAISNSAYQSVIGSWNLTVNSVANGTITSTVSQGWEALAPKGGNTINVGMIVSSSSANFMPTTITINGIPCTISTGP